MRNELLQSGIRLFNSRQFFECHEVLEEAWRPESGPQRLSMQSSIHLAVGLYHTQRSNPAGASRQLRKGLRKLAGYLPCYEGIDTARLYRDVVAALEHIEAGAEGFEYPDIHNSTDNDGGTGATMQT
jgi:predicted metal-dependent hydrolase